MRVRVKRMCGCYGGKGEVHVSVLGMRSIKLHTVPPNIKSDRATVHLQRQRLELNAASILLVTLAFCLEL